VTAGRLLIAIDGPAAAGKGTLALRLAERFQLPHLDTGLLYRAIGRRMADEAADLDDATVAGTYARALVPADLQRGELRGREAGELASRVAVHGTVRAALVEFQRAFAAQPGGAVLDGRDIGTVICPDADVKLFVTASPEVRARRRTDELLAKGRHVEYERILAEVLERDERDSTRAVAPLKPAGDAVVIDTSALTRDGAFEAAVAAVNSVLSGRPA
jgi:cytidylate kinase